MPCLQPSGAEEVICYGVAFYKKWCAVKREKRMEM